MEQQPRTIDTYIATFPPEVQEVLLRIRAIIHAAVPDAQERIHYNMPMIGVDGQYFVYFAAWKRHIGMYPIPELAPELEAEVAIYRAAKDTLRFPFRQPIPYELIARIIPALVEHEKGNGTRGK
ncbi:hypothetical protein AYO38_10750 [bacterium SCGC AG-212-C10]|nr:hypothetical protein AYO38_10750 [bacterium SCGC AG-212-C10]